MKFSTFALFGLCGSSFASAIPRAAHLQKKAASPVPADLEKKQIFSDTSQIRNAIQTVTSAAADLDAIILSINSADLTQLLELYSASSEIVTTIQDATAQVQGAPNIGLISALPVQLDATRLISTIKKTLSDLVSKKPYIDEAGVTSLVVTSLEQQQAAGDELSDALSAKVPALVGFLADLDGSIIDSAFDWAIEQYNAE